MTGARNRSLGRIAEKAVADYLAAHGFPLAEPRSDGSHNPYGDVANIFPVVIEVKAEAKWRPAAYVKQLAEEMNATDAEVGAVFIKPPGVGLGRVAEWHALLPVELLVQLLRAAGYGTPLDSATADYQAKVRDLKAQRAELMGGDAA